METIGTPWMWAGFALFVVAALAVLVREVKGVVHRTRRVVRRDVERFEIVVVVFNLGPLHDFEAGLLEQGLRGSRFLIVRRDGRLIAGDGNVQIVDYSPELGDDAIEVHVIGIEPERYGQWFPTQATGFQDTLAVPPRDP